MKKYLMTLVVIGVVFINSCTEELFEQDISAKKVTVIAPGNNVQLTDFDVSFFWENNADVISYRLQVATPNFTSPHKVLLDTLITNNTFDVTLTENDYQWRVRAENSAYQGVYTSQFFSVINNDNFYKNTITLLSPEDNAIVKDTTQIFTWQPVTGTVTYGIQILDKENKVLSDTKVAKPTFTYNFKEGTYTWKVRADNDVVTTAYASRQITIDTSYVESSARGVK